MRMIGPTAFLAAASGFVCVAMGAFAAHAVKDPQAKDWIETGAQYQIMHTMAALASLSFRNWGAPRARFAPVFFFAGIVLFSGSLYAMAFGAPRAIAILTPIGGLCFLIGWAILAIVGAKLAGRGFSEAKEPSPNAPKETAP